MHFIDKSFRVEFQVLAQMYFTDDFPELFLYVSSSKDPPGELDTRNNMGIELSRSILASTGPWVNRALR